MLGLSKVPALPKRALLATAVALLVCEAPLGAQPKLTAWKATEVWRVDGSEHGDPFQDVRDYVSVADGSLWVLDFKDQNIRRYDAQGKAISIVGRRGSGPGELRDANGMVVHPDNSVWVNDPRNNRISIFSPDGKFKRQVIVGQRGYGYRWTSWFSPKGDELQQQSMGGGSRDWERVDLQGKVIGTMPATSCPTKTTLAVGFYHAKDGSGGSGMNGSYPFTMGGGVVPDLAGNVWCAAPTSTRVALRKLNAPDTIAVTAIEVPGIPVGPAERADNIARIEKSLAQYATEDFDASKIPTVKPGIAALYVDSDNRLWVAHTPVYQSKQSTFDVFDPKGKHLGRVTLPVRTNSFLPVRARGNSVWIVAFDDDDISTIVHYRLQK